MERLVTNLFLEEDLQLALVLSECWPTPTTMKVKSNISHPSPHPHPTPSPSSFRCWRHWRCARSVRWRGMWSLSSPASTSSRRWAGCGRRTMNATAMPCTVGWGSTPASSRARSSSTSFPEYRWDDCSGDLAFVLVRKGWCWFLEKGVI